MMNEESYGRNYLPSCTMPQATEAARTMGEESLVGLSTFHLLVEETIHWNNLGVQMWHTMDRSGQCCTTMDQLLYAFQRATDALWTLRQEIICIAPGYPYDDREQPRPQNPLRALYLDQHPMRTGHMGCLNNSNSEYYIYDRPLLLSHPALAKQQHQQLTMEDMEAFIVTATVTTTFNSALAWHRYSVIKPATTLYQTMAARLYDAVLSILANINVVYATAEHPTSGAVLKSLVLNNRAYLYYEFCDYEKCEQCLLGMQDVLFDTSFEEYVDVNYMDEIRLNMLFFQHWTVARAA